MSSTRPDLVVTLPAHSVEEARRQADDARLAGADLAEVRLDRWLPRERRRIAGLFPASLPLIATLRSKAEGGEGPDDPVARETALTAIAQEPFEFIDLEAARDRRFEAHVGALGHRVVRSSHLPAGSSVREVRALLEEEAPPNGMVKVVVPATLSHALQDLFPLVEGAPEPRPILLATGPCGSLWRGWSGRLRLPWVYASLPSGRATETVEPSQVPVDRLGPFLAATDAPIFAVVGHPVSHSRSPAIHHGWMRRAGVSGLYVTLEVLSPEEFRLAVEVLPSRGVRGLNITHPWKRLAYECATVRSPDAVATGVANCLTFKDGHVEAENTDLGGVQRRLEELRDQGRWKGSELTLLGSGGAARATLAAVRRLGGHATLFARRPSEAEGLAREFGASIGDTFDPGRTDLVVHATDMGRAGRGPLELPLRALLSSRSYLLDWVYDPDLPTVAEVARDVGAAYEDGRRLLVYQAAESYRTWWGAPPDNASIDEALREVGCVA